MLQLAASRGPLLVGAARVPADPPYPVPMGGYAGASFLDLRRLRDPLDARAIVIDAGGLRVALVAVDRVLIPPGLREAVESRPEFQSSGVEAWILGATHTHTAPGCHVRSWPAELFGTGAYDPLIVEHLAGRIAEAVFLASTELTPCRMDVALADVDAPWASFNRRDPDRPPARPLDVVRFTRVTAGGGGGKAGGEGEAGGAATVARWLSFPAHPTLIPFYLRRASGDYAGAACRLLEAASGGVTLFACGPSADLAAGAPGDFAPAGWERRVERIGRRLAVTAEALERAIDARGAPPEDGLVAAHIAAAVRLPPRRPWRVPFVGRDIALEYPEIAVFQCLRLGDVLILGFPGEMAQSLGERIGAGVRKATGARRVLIWTLADDYIGYAFPEAEHEEGGKSVHLAVYGPELAPLLEERLLRIAVRCWEAGPSRQGGSADEG